MNERLLDFLRNDLALPESEIRFALRHHEQEPSQADPSLLPLTLWQYGLVSLDQLDRIFDWLGIL